MVFYRRTRVSTEVKLGLGIVLLLAVPFLWTSVRAVFWRPEGLEKQRRSMSKYGLNWLAEIVGPGGFRVYAAVWIVLLAIAWGVMAYQWAIAVFGS
jgi:hypothetical protein